AISAVPLVDVSEPTDNLLWEIEQMNARFGQRSALVCALDRVGQLTGEARPGSVLARVQAQLDGHDVLAYPTDDAGVRRFRHALRSMLERQVRGRTRLVTPVKVRS